MNRAAVYLPYLSFLSSFWDSIGYAARINLLGPARMQSSDPFAIGTYLNRTNLQCYYALRTFVLSTQIQSLTIVNENCDKIPTKIELNVHIPVDDFRRRFRRAADGDIVPGDGDRLC